MDHIAEKGYVGSIHYGLVRKPVSIQEVMKIPEAKVADEKEMEQKEHSSMGRKTMSRTHGSSEEEWKKQFTSRIWECRTCKTPPDIQRASCASGRGTRSKTQKNTRGKSRSKVLQRLRQRQSSWTPSQSFLVWPWRNKWRNFSFQSSQIVTIARRRMSWNLNQDSSTTKTKKLE